MKIKNIKFITIFLLTIVLSVFASDSLLLKKEEIKPWSSTVKGTLIGGSIGLVTGLGSSVHDRNDAYDTFGPEGIFIAYTTLNTSIWTSLGASVGYLGKQKDLRMGALVGGTIAIIASITYNLLNPITYNYYQENDSYKNEHYKNSKIIGYWTLNVPLVTLAGMWTGAGIEYLLK